MNYLAHIFLSNNNPKLQIGNFIGDFVKGSQYKKYPEIIQKGIVLHREIDSFTDAHPYFIKTVEILQPTFGRYSGILVDIFFDYILATDFEQYSGKTSLKVFSRRFYINVLRHYFWLPKSVKSFIFHFVRNDQLGRYAHYDGLQKSLQLMADHKSDAIQPQLSVAFLKEHENDIRKNFHRFMPDLIRFVEDYLSVDA